MSVTTYAIAAASLASVSWGVCYAATQNLLQKSSPARLLALTHLVAALLTSPALVFGGEPFSAGNWTDIKEFTVYIMFRLLAEISIFVSIKSIGGVSSGLIEVSYPLFTAITLYLFQGEKPTSYTMFGGSLIFLGIIVIAFAKEEETVTSSSSRHELSTVFGAHLSGRRLSVGNLLHERGGEDVVGVSDRSTGYDTFAAE